MLLLDNTKEAKVSEVRRHCNDEEVLIRMMVKNLVSNMHDNDVDLAFRSDAKVVMMIITWLIKPLFFCFLE